MGRACSSGLVRKNAVKKKERRAFAKARRSQTDEKGKEVKEASGEKA